MTAPGARSIRTVEDVLRLLDSIFETAADRWTDRGAAWWDRFYDDRGRGVPFFRPTPDESLAAWSRDGLLGTPGRALDLGCGPGRNAIWLAQQGYRVDALDLSAAAIDWSRERAADAGVDVTFTQGSIFDWNADGSISYDLVYDSGCFHHLPPHRRISYRSLLERSLAPGAAFGIACFAAGVADSGSETPDEALYREGGLQGGLAYRDDDLRRIFDWLTEVEVRPMRQRPAGSAEFGEPFLSAALFRAELTASRRP